MKGNRPTVEGKDLKLIGDSLYATLLNENKAAGFDPFRDGHDDMMRSDAISRIQKDTLMRTTIHGPSITKEKFTSKYWRKWHHEKVLLEDISRKEIITTERKASKTEKLKKNASNAALIPRKVLSHAKSHSFGVAPDRNPSKKLFDSHVLGPGNEPQRLFQNSYARKVPVDPAERNSMYDPNDIGSNHNVPGGAMPMTNYNLAREIKTNTQNCDYPPMATLLASNVGTKFQSAPRFPTQPRGVKSEPADDSGASAAVSSGSAFSSGLSAGRLPGNSSFVFPREERAISKFSSSVPINGSADTTGTGPDGVVVTATTTSTNTNKNDTHVDIHSTPGPGQYDVPRLFEGKEYRTAQDFKDTYDKYAAMPKGLIEVSKPDLAAIACFGKGCSRQEHILYGMCLDGKCFTRAEFEGTIIRRNDLRRLAGYDAVDRIGKNKESIKDDIILGQMMTSLLPDPVYELNALYTAAFRGDCDAICKMARLKVDPNTQHSDSGYTALHCAVARNQVQAVLCLLDEFRGVIRLDIQDRKGDTALHLGSRLGFAEAVGLICDEEACDPYCVRNRNGEYPTDINKNHRVYQHLRLAIDRNALKNELKTLKESRKTELQHLRNNAIV